MEEGREREWCLQGKMNITNMWSESFPKKLKPLYSIVVNPLNTNKSSKKPCIQSKTIWNHIFAKHACHNSEQCEDKNNYKHAKLQCQDDAA